MICRRNDTPVDVDNGTRGTVRRLGRERVAIDTDGGAGARATRGGMPESTSSTPTRSPATAVQGATVQAAFIVACPGDLTAGWSYTALSRARATHASLFVHDERPPDERLSYAPADRHCNSRGELLATVSRGCTSVSRKI